MGRLCIVSVLVYLLVKGEGNIKLYAVDLINNLIKDVLKQCYLGREEGGMHFDLGIQGRNLELQELQGRGDNCSSLTGIWRNWGWASHRFRRAPAGVCMQGALW